jgi:hypothetical protein
MSLRKRPESETVTASVRRPRQSRAGKRLELETVTASASASASAPGPAPFAGQEAEPEPIPLVEEWHCEAAPWAGAPARQHRTRWRPAVSSLAMCENCVSPSWLQPACRTSKEIRDLPSRLHENIAPHLQSRVIMVHFTTRLYLLRSCRASSSVSFCHTATASCFARLRISTHTSHSVLLPAGELKDEIELSEPRVTFPGYVNVTRGRRGQRPQWRAPQCADG